MTNEFKCGCLKNGKNDVFKDFVCVCGWVGGQKHVYF